MLYERNVTPYKQDINWCDLYQQLSAQHHRRAVKHLEQNHYGAACKRQKSAAMYARYAAVKLNRILTHGYRDKTR